MINTVVLLFVLISSFMAMFALVTFAQRIIDRPLEAKRRSQNFEAAKPPAS